MIFDEGARFEQNLEKWERIDLPAFRFVEWVDNWRWVARHETARSIVTDLGVRHDEAPDASITITSHRPDDPQDLRRWVLTNMASQVLRDRVKDDGGLERKTWERRHKRIESDLGNGRTPWAAGVARIDGNEQPCEAVALDEHWCVFVYMLDVHVTIVGRHVPLPEIRLVTIDSAAPSIDDPKARMSTGRLLMQTVVKPESKPSTP